MPYVGRHRRSSYPVRRHRTPTTWADSLQGASLATGHNSNGDLLAGLEVAGSTTVGLTVLRTHLMLQVNGFSAQSDYMLVGLAIVPIEDIGTVVDWASRPYMDWMLRYAVYPTYSGGTLDTGRIVEFDIRAKRRLREMQQTYAICTKAVTASATISYNSLCRTLVRLP